MAKEFVVYSKTKAKFEAQVASGEVDNTQIGIIAESGEFWEKGNYHPLVMLTDYLKKTDAVALAKDLTGVLEATPEEFTFRPSAGTKSIRDESAVIRRIKGNTSVWGQLANINETFVNIGNRYIITRNDDGSVTIKRDPTITEGYWCALDMDKSYRNSSHEYLFYADVSVSGVASSTDSCRVSVYDLSTASGNNTQFRSNGRHTFCCFGTPLTSTTNWQFAFFAYGVAELTIHNLQCFDLTAIFCAGNEPTTLEEFKRLYPDSYYPYCEPQVRSMRATGIETIGFNAFNGEYAEVLGDMQYCLCGDFTSIGFSDTIGGDITDITIPEDGIYTPPKRGYIYASSTNICIHLVHSGVCNGEYHDYWKSMRTLPDIAKYFPDGMHGIGDVYDEINEENAIKRFGVVDLGTLSWRSTTASNGTRRWQTTSLISLIKGTPATGFGNMRCIKYDVVSANNTWFNVKGISVDLSGYLYIYDSDKDAATTPVADFVASLQGVMLVYELAEPIVTPVTEPLQWDCKVADFGTEKMLSDLPSSPFRADIVYQFNAEGRIRDNSRNIERLEAHTKNMATMEDVLNAIPTEAATATQRSENLGTSGNTSISPNIMYEYYAGLGEFSSFVLPMLYVPSGDYDNRWMLRLPSIATSSILSYPYTIKWKDGVAPTFSEPCTLEIYLKKANTGEIIGEWKIYR